MHEKETALLLDLSSMLHNHFISVLRFLGRKAKRIYLYLEEMDRKHLLMPSVLEGL